MSLHRLLSPLPLPDDAPFLTFWATCSFYLYTGFLSWQLWVAMFSPTGKREGGVEREEGERRRKKAYKPQKVYKALEVELPGGRRSCKQLPSQQDEQRCSDSAR